MIEQRIEVETTVKVTVTGFHENPHGSKASRESEREVRSIVLSVHEYGDDTGQVPEIMERLKKLVIESVTRTTSD